MGAEDGDSYENNKSGNDCYIPPDRVGMRTMTVVSTTNAVRTSTYILYLMFNFGHYRMV